MSDQTPDAQLRSGLQQIQTAYERKVREMQSINAKSFYVQVYRQRKWPTNWNDGNRFVRIRSRR